MRLIRLLSTSVVLAAAIVGFGAAPAANAQVLCEQAGVSGDLPAAGTSQCEDQILAGWCDYQHEGVNDPTVNVYWFVCLPAPLVAP